MKACQRDLLAFVALLELTTVLASVYPTQPIADTVFTSGHLAHIYWKDDGWTPHLKDMGLMNIDLYVNPVGSDMIQMNTGHYVTTLARDVAPITRSHTVIIPLNLPANASFYILHFKPSSPHPHWYPKSHQHSTPRPHAHPTIYSANFQIAPITQTANSNTDMFPIFSLPLPQSQSTPTSTPTSVSEMTTATSGPQRNESNSGDANQQDAQATLQNGNRNWERMDTTRFRLLFMLWPALVGFSMAL